LRLFVAGCGDSAQKQAAPPPPAVTVAKPVKRTVFDFDEYVGRFVAVNSVEVRRARLRLSRRRAFQGRPDHQAKATCCFTIDKRPFQNAVTRRAPT